jgi:hypothetical protein
MSELGQELSIKTIWKKIEDQGFRFFCVGCNQERRLAPPSAVGSPKFFAHILISTAFLSTLTYPWLHWKGLYAFLIPVGLVFEMIYRMKMRASLVCPACSFDPMLYMVNRDKAVRQVEETWRKKFADHGIPYPELKKQKVQKEDLLTSV